MALMAEDLLGRSLDEPAAPVDTPPAGHGPLTRTGTPVSLGGADVWDAAMPLLAEG